jgi:hypothetical protein
MFLEPCSKLCWHHFFNIVDLLLFQFCPIHATKEEINYFIVTLILNKVGKNKKTTITHSLYSLTSSQLFKTNQTMES